MENIFNFTGIVDDPEQKRMICGRTNDIKSILNEIYAGKSIALFGERRIGKTAVLLLIRDIVNGDIAQYSERLLDRNLQEALTALRPQNGWKAMYLDCLGLHNLPDQFFERICAFVSGNSEGSLTRSGEGHNLDFVAAIKELHGRLSESERIVVLVDEVEELLRVESSKGTAIFNALRSVIQSCPRICFVLAGAEHWHQAINTKTSPLVNNVSTLYLRTPEPYPIESYLIGYLTQRLSEGTDVERTVVNWTGYKPYYVQAVCGEIASICQEGKPLPSDWKDVVEPLVVKQVKSTIKAFFESDNLDDTTRKILALLAHTPGLSVKEIAEKLGVSKERIWNRISDLQALAKVYQDKSGYRIVGSLLERWGKRNEENPAKSPWPQRLRWGMAFILLILCIAVYSYTHPPLRNFSYVLPDVSVSVYLPASLEQDETGRANVRIQNTTASSVYTATVWLSSSDIHFRDGESNRVTLTSVYPGETRYWEPSFIAYPPASGSTFSINISVIQEANPTMVSPAFQVSYRPVPLKQYWVVINGILVAIGAFINKSDLMQLAINLWGVLKKTHSTAGE